MVRSLKATRKATRLILWGRSSNAGHAQESCPVDHLAGPTRARLGLKIISTYACFATFEDLRSDSRGPYSKLERLASCFLISDEYDINPDAYIARDVNESA